MILIQRNWFIYNITYGLNKIINFLTKLLRFIPYAVSSSYGGNGFYCRNLEAIQFLYNLFTAETASEHFNTCWHDIVRGTAYQNWNMLRRVMVRSNPRMYAEVSVSQHSRTNTNKYSRGNLCVRSNTRKRSSRFVEITTHSQSPVGSRISFLSLFAFHRQQTSWRKIHASILVVLSSLR